MGLEAKDQEKQTRDLAQVVTLAAMQGFLLLGGNVTVRRGNQRTDVSGRGDN